MADSSFYGYTGTTVQVQNTIQGSLDLAAQAAAAADTSETNAAASATAAAASAAQASTSTTSAQNHANTAQTHSTSASTSATAAAASATTAAGHATTTAADAVQTAADAVQTAADAATAATAATNAGTSETNAATSETNAATSATSAASSASTASTAATNAGTSETNAATSATNAATSAANASTSETNAATSETNAASSASSASTSATAAATSATNAATSETNAASSETNAAASATAAETAYDDFDDRYLGSKVTTGGDPTVDNDGNALVTGALFFDETNSLMKVWTGSAWLVTYASNSGGLTAANNLSDLNNAATARSNLGLDTAAVQPATAFATAAQGTLAASAVQPGDNISGLTNDSGYITSVPAQSFASLTGKPTTIAGYGITDSPTAVSSLTNDSGYLTSSTLLSAITSVDGAASGVDADLLDGQHGSYYLDGNNFTNLPAGYSGWTVSDGTNSETVADSDTVTFSGSGATTVAYNTTTNTLSVSSTDTTYTNATTSAAGLMSSTDKAKLDGFSTSGVTNGQVLAYNSTSTDFEPTTITSDLVGDTTPQLGGDLDVNSNNILMGNQSVKFGTSAWEIVFDSADNDLNFKYNGTTVFKLSSAGAVVAADDITGFGTP
jgi:hypothetical protein